MSSESGIDELVKLYLQSKGYHKALEAMKEDATTLPADGSNTHSSMETASKSTANGKAADKNIEKLLLNAAESFCFLGIKHNDISIYQKEYDQLHSWMNHSLDAIKSYLQAITFVLFVYW
jgi:hypothetical protein